LGKQLMNKKVGEQFDFMAGLKKIKIKILEIK